MKPATRIILLAILILIGAYSRGAREASAYNFTVNSTADAVDSNPGDTFCKTPNDVCTLRAAIQEANSFPIEHNITLPAGTYNLSLGELIVTENISIYGAGQGNVDNVDTIIDGKNASRIFRISDGVPLTLNNLRLRNGAHTADGPKTGGGAIYNQGTLIALNMTLTGNQGKGAAGNVSYGGGIFNDGTLNLNYCTFSNNQADNGGGLFNNGTAVITNVAFDNSSAGSGFGGGIYNGGTLTLEKTTIRGRTDHGSVAGNGGAIFNDGIMDLTNVTLSGNSVTGSGGAIYNGIVNGGSPATLTNVTISDNSAAGNGGGIFNNTGNTVTLKNTIVANNTDSTGRNCSGAMTSNGHNLEKGISCGLSSTGDLNNTDPQLGSLQNNEGPTLTQALGSVIAKNVGAGCPATDQRGYPRNPAACDIGAYEDTTDNPIPAITTLDPHIKPAGASDFELIVNGYTYVFSGLSVIYWNGSSKPTTFVNTSRIKTIISATEIATAGKIPVTVFNPQSGGGFSNVVNFTITSANPSPTITTLSPNTRPAGGPPFTMTVNGSNFLDNSLSVVLWNGIARPTAFVSPSQLTADIPSTDLAAMGTASVTVSNSPPVGGISDPPAPFTIGPPNLYLPIILRN